MVLSEMKIKSSDELVDRLTKLTNSIRADKKLSWSLNSGGCAFFAARVAKVAGLNVLGLSVFDDGERSQEIFPKVLSESNSSKKNQTVAFWNDNGIHFNHVVVKFLVKGRVMFYDGIHGIMDEATCVRKFRDYAYGEEVGVAPVELIMPLTKNQRGWNPAFRSRAEVARLIKGHLQDKWNS